MGDVSTDLVRNDQTQRGLPYRGAGEGGVRGFSCIHRAIAGSLIGITHSKTLRPHRRCERCAVGCFCNSIVACEVPANGFVAVGRQRQFFLHQTRTYRATRLRRPRSGPSADLGVDRGFLQPPPLVGVNPFGRGLHTKSNGFWSWPYFAAGTTVTRKARAGAR